MYSRNIFKKEIPRKEFYEPSAPDTSSSSSSSNEFSAPCSRSKPKKTSISNHETGLDFKQNTWYVVSSLKILSNKEYPDIQSLLEVLNVWGDYYIGPESLKQLYTIFYVSLGLHIRQSSAAIHSYIYEATISDRITLKHNFVFLSDPSISFAWNHTIPNCRFGTCIRFECVFKPSEMKGKPFRSLHKVNYSGHKSIPSLKHPLSDYGIKVITMNNDYIFST
ncbi:matrix protein [jopcycgri virus 1]|uniref:Matrix protein n=1 Tax=jopcycgri virus 1 TaxID=2992924 RepID=A0A9E7VB16_9RHAB|nr:matrix protein [jopcycgri virus 1]